jgi:hypothetical protein
VCGCGISRDTVGVHGLVVVQDKYMIKAREKASHSCRTTVLKPCFAGLGRDLRQCYSNRFPIIWIQCELASKFEWCLWNNRQANRAFFLNILKLTNGPIVWEAPIRSLCECIWIEFVYDYKLKLFYVRTDVVGRHARPTVFYWTGIEMWINKEYNSFALLFILRFPYF